ncbi:MAG: hypothetical protein QT11_C0001G0872 [archaeon GW2011_AR20]|nr:MAG: hypothetical protein QT11_C0001G0872 [archaeon GW2011_AR20]MBS3160236.1 hypothetical protein [Candidatus Woesearchaeota archaeon]
MMDFKNILKKLEELETNEEKVEFLKGLLEELDDEDLINEVKELIKEFEEDLESKLNVDVSLRKISREIDIDDNELDAEQIQRNLPQRQAARPDLAIRQNEEDLGEFRYSSNSNYSNLALYSQQSFDYQTLEGSFNTDIMKQNLVRESILNPESSLTEIEKENLGKKLRESMPGASEEKILIYQAKITDELKKDEKSRYIARLK